MEQIVAEVKAFGCDLVEITGGEPLLQKDVPQLAQKLLDEGYTVLVETSGERDISVLDKRTVRIMDIKCPGSGECERNRWENLTHLRSTDEVKFVIQDRADYEWAVEVLHKQELAQRCHVLFSPVFGALNPQDVAAWILADKLPVRFQLQIHKIIWSPDTKGV